MVGFGQFGYEKFAAQNSFRAVMGQATGQFFGGGAEVRIGSGLFLNPSLEHFTRTGDRVVVVDREVFKLGLPDTVSLTPMTMTAGPRLLHDGAPPPVGGGRGRIPLQEHLSL